MTRLCYLGKNSKLYPVKWDENEEILGDEIKNKVEKLMLISREAVKGYHP